jgi:hypothetical protein
MRQRHVKCHKSPRTSRRQKRGSSTWRNDGASERVWHPSRVFNFVAVGSSSLSLSPERPLGALPLHPARMKNQPRQVASPAPWRPSPLALTGNGIARSISAPADSQQQLAVLEKGNFATCTALSCSQSIQTWTSTRVPDMPTNLPDPRKRKSSEEWEERFERILPVVLRAALVTAAVILIWSYYAGG